MRPSRNVGLLLLALSCPRLLHAQWTQWGGPNRNFTVDSEVAPAWTSGGPREIWSRPLGDGYSSILADEGRLYTMKREGHEDVVVSLDAGTGKTLWETTYDSPIAPDMDVEMGPGPISTPLIAGDRIFTVSTTVKLHCLDKRTGRILWGRDLMKDLGAPHLGRGYGASPIAYRGLVILTLGEPGPAVVAFDQERGDFAWKSQGFRPSWSSPILIEVEGEPQLVVAMGSDRAGLDPSTGELRWHHAMPPSADIVMSTPHWGEDQILFFSQAYGDGSRALRLEKKDGRFEAEEQWYSRQMRVMFGSVARIGDFVYGSSGDFGPAFLVGINVKTGKVAWRKRGFGRAHLLLARENVVILDEEGDLAIATFAPEGLTVHARASVLERLAWTPPTLVGKTLYLRNRSVIKAVDLGG